MVAIILVGFGPPFELRGANPQMNWFIKRNLVYRELDIQIANVYARAFEKVWLLTYDDQMYAKRYVAELAANVDVLFRPRTIPPIAYGLMAPLIHRRHFRAASVCKTFELRGSITALLSKLLYGTMILLRQGYEVSGVIKSVQAAGGSLLIRSRIYMMLMSVYELVSSHLANAVVVESTTHKQRLANRFSVNPRKIFVVPNWVDSELFKPMPSALKEKGRIVFVGSLNLVKNVFNLVDAVKGIPEVRLYLVGDGPLRKTLEQKLREDATKNVVILGAVQHARIPLELCKSEVFVLPSFFEGSPRALLEAMACGLPAIGSNVAGIREIIKNGITGLMCDVNAESIRRTITALLSDSKLRSELGSNARMHIERNYAFQNVLENEIRILNSMLISGSLKRETDA